MTVRLPPSFLQNITDVAQGHTAQNDRLTIGSSYKAGTAPLSGRSGILPGPAGGVGEVSVVSNTLVRVQAFRAAIQGTRSALQGQYTVINDGVVDLAVGAQASGVVRTDTLMVNVCDTAFSPDTLDTARLIVVPGAAVASNPQPASLGGANLGNYLILGYINVPATGGTVTFTPVAGRTPGGLTVAPGGILPVSAAETAPGNDGDYRDHPTLGLQRWNPTTTAWESAPVGLRNWGTSGVMVGTAPPAGTPLLAETAYGTVTVNANGDGTVVYPRAFPNGVIFVDLHHQSVGGPPSNPIIFLPWSPTLSQTPARAYVGTGVVASLSIAYNIIVIGW